MTDIRLRALVAVLLGTLGALLGVAGVGHAYLREWRRAVAWFAAVIGATLVLFATFADPEVAADPDAWPTEVVVPVLVLLSLSIFDAYYVARRAGGGTGTPGEADGGGADADGATRCPNCGREVDGEYAFCAWCAEPLDADAGE